MTDKVPEPDALPGPIKYKEPAGKPEDRPLERLHRDHKKTRDGEQSKG